MQIHIYIDLYTQINQRTDKSMSFKDIYVEMFIFNSSQWLCSDEKAFSSNEFVKYCRNDKQELWHGRFIHDLIENLPTIILTNRIPLNTACEYIYKIPRMHDRVSSLSITWPIRRLAQTNSRTSVCVCPSFVILLLYFDYFLHRQYVNIQLQLLKFHVPYKYIQIRTHAYSHRTPTCNEQYSKRYMYYYLARHRPHRQMALYVKIARV